MTPLATLVMYAAAGAFALLGAVTVTRRAATAPAVYRRRIAGSMFLALALILATFATTFRLAQT